MIRFSFQEENSGSNSRGMAGQIKAKMEIQKAIAVIKERDEECLEENSGSEDKGIEIHLREKCNGHNLWDFVTDGMQMCM